MHGGAAGVIFGTRKKNCSESSFDTSIQTWARLRRSARYQKKTTGSEAVLLFNDLFLLTPISFQGGVTRALNITYLRAVPISQSYRGGD